jgi:hypothetical protein
MHPRVRYWETALVRWAREQAGRPYVWGVTDCATLARAALAVVFGRDVAPGLPVWKSQASASRIAKRTRVSDALRTLGAIESQAAFAGAGAVVTVPDDRVPGGESVCVVVSAGIALYAQHDTGVTLHRAPEVGTAWTLVECADG